MVKTKAEEVVVDDKKFMSTFLKTNKDSHYNFLEERYYKVSSGSLTLDSVLDGGFGPGLHRNVGINSGGKTSEALEVCRNFFATLPDAKAVFFNAEGRLGKDIKERSGLTYVYDPNDWNNHTVLVIDTNIYEAVAEAIEGLIHQDTKTFYFMLVDSVDALVLKNDIKKTFEDSSKVAGGAVIASTLMKRNAIPLQKKGHMAFFLSQVRSDVQLDPYAPKQIRQISGTGGNALLHYANIILDFQPRFKGDLIATDEKSPPSPSNPLLGHWCKVIIKKSNNEKNNFQVTYPIKYGVKHGTSIWREKEIIDCLLAWEFLEKGGAWFNFSADIVEDSGGLITAEKIQGLNAVYEYLSKNQPVVEFLYTHLQKHILPAAIEHIDEA